VWTLGQSSAAPAPPINHRTMGERFDLGPLHCRMDPADVRRGKPAVVPHDTARDPRDK